MSYWGCVHQHLWLSFLVGSSVSRISPLVCMSLAVSEVSRGGWDLSVHLTPLRPVKLLILPFCSAWCLCESHWSTNAKINLPTMELGRWILGCRRQDWGRSSPQLHPHPPPIVPLPGPPLWAAPILGLHRLSAVIFFHSTETSTHAPNPSIPSNVWNICGKTILPSSLFGLFNFCSLF